MQGRTVKPCGSLPLTIRSATRPKHSSLPILPAALVQQGEVRGRSTPHASHHAKSCAEDRALDCRNRRLFLYLLRALVAQLHELHARYLRAPCLSSPDHPSGRSIHRCKDRLRIWSAPHRAPLAKTFEPTEYGRGARTT